jgi:hypothetical protein
MFHCSATYRSAKNVAPIFFRQGLSRVSGEVGEPRHNFGLPGFTNCNAALNNVHYLFMDLRQNAQFT